MAVTPTGPMGMMLDACCSLSAASTTFQTAVGVASEADAKPSCYPWYRTGSGSMAFRRPFILWTLPESVLDWGDYASGTVAMLFQRDVPAEYADDDTTSDAVFDFLNVLDAIIGEMWTLSEAGGRPLIQRHGVRTTGPQRNRKTEQDDYFEQWVTFMVGLKAGGG